MNKVRDIPWPRIVAEGTAIVVSILLAFSIQAWWDDKQNRADLRNSLSAVLDDFQESKELVKDRRSFASAQRESIVRLFEIANDDQGKHDETIIDGLLRDVSWYKSDVPVIIAALDALLSSGKLESLRNDTLRRNLADWPVRIAFIDTQVSVDKQFGWEIWSPFIQQKGLYPQIWNTHDRYPGNSEPISTHKFPVSLRHSVDHSQLFADNEFLNVLWQGWVIQENVLSTMTSADNSLDESIDLLREELNQ